jgi:hypothetical protein
LLGTTNSILFTPAAYLLAMATYRGARCCSSARQAESGTSTFSTPRENSSARVRAATADPQTTGHASSGACPAGAFRKLPMRSLSTPGAIDSTRFRFYHSGKLAGEHRATFVRPSDGRDCGACHLISGESASSLPIFRIAILRGPIVPCFGKFISALICYD